MRTTVFPAIRRRTPSIVYVIILMLLLVNLIGPFFREDAQTARINEGWADLYIRQELRVNPTSGPLLLEAQELEAEHRRLQERAIALRRKQLALIGSSSRSIDRFLLREVTIPYPVLEERVPTELIYGEEGAPSRKLHAFASGLLIGASGAAGISLEHEGEDPLQRVLENRLMRGQPTPYYPRNGSFHGIPSPLNPNKAE